MDAKKNDYRPGADDFERIKGIGKSIAQALEECGIHRFEDLIAHTPASLADLLKTHLPTISAERIERGRWLEQARELIGARGDVETHPAVSRERPGDGPEAAEPAAPEWRELADFFVSFGYRRDDRDEERLFTRIHHSQAGNGREWEGVRVKELLDWMLAQAGLTETLASPDEMETMLDSPDLDNPAELRFEEIWVSQVEEPVLSGGEQAAGGQQQSAGKQPSGKQPARKQQRSRLRVSSRISLASDEVTGASSGKVPLTLELYLINRRTKSVQLVDSYTRFLQPGVDTYEQELEFPVPPLGEYQLYAIARVPPPLTSIAHLQGPLVEVSP